MKLRNTLAVIVLAVGSLQMLGHLIHSRVLRGIGLASGIAPFTKVFCAADGYEAFAATFTVEGTRQDGSRWSRRLTPEWYAKLKGPYNRRNVYGAALAFAPRLPEDLRIQLIDECLSPGSPMCLELEIPADLQDLRVTIIPREGEKHGPWTYTASKP